MFINSLIGKRRLGMFFGMGPEQLESFLERIAATTIANDAALKCTLCGIQPTAENITMFVGDFVDPSCPQIDGLVIAIQKAIDDIARFSERRNILNS